MTFHIFSSGTACNGMTRFTRTNIKPDSCRQSSPHKAHPQCKTFHFIIPDSTRIYLLLLIIHIHFYITVFFYFALTVYHKYILLVLYLQIISLCFNFYTILCHRYYFCTFLFFLLYIFNNEHCWREVEI